MTAQKMIRGYKALYEYIPLGKTRLLKLIEEGKLHRPVMLGPRSPAWREEWVAEAQKTFERDSGV
jgi:predicted DNA-binding transcriptional regulator AlpA